ncbi:MAG: Spi family protease inhibitor [Muribaculaceae bacterium]|nr:Spi family protease inhibitor [Muribaculaceae bacterium]
MKRSLLLALAALSGIGLYAAPISPQEALQRLGGMTRAGVEKDLRLAFTTRQNDGEAAVYVFNKVGAQGYVVLRADD